MRARTGASFYAAAVPGADGAPHAPADAGAVARAHGHARIADGRAGLRADAAGVSGADGAPHAPADAGAVARALDSDKVLRLPAGTAVVVEVAEQLPDKKTRYLLVEPVVGWVSRGAVAKAG